MINKDKGEFEKAADEFGRAWEDACYKAGTHGLVNVFYIGVALLLLAALIGLLTEYVHGAAGCLTYREARERWPTRHLYWHSGDHCWDATRGGRRYHQLRKRLREQDSPVIYDYAAEPKKEKKPEPTIMYPSVFYSLAPVSPVWMNPDPSTLAYRLLDIDELTGKMPDPPECCWPELVRDAQGNLVLK